MHIRPAYPGESVQKPSGAGLARVDMLLSLANLFVGPPSAKKSRSTSQRHGSGGAERRCRAQTKLRLIVPSETKETLTQPRGRVGYVWVDSGLMGKAAELEWRWCPAPC